MAKKDKSSEDNITFLGQDVDPDLQAKVDSYMEGDDQETKKVEFDTPEIVNNQELTGSAPLLPTDELPEMAKQKTSDKKESKDDQTDESEEDNQTFEDPIEEEPSESEEDQEPNQEDSKDDENPEEVLDADLINLDKDPDEVAAPGFEEDDKTIGEAIDGMNLSDAGLDDPKTSQAIDEIVAEDSDQLLAAEDAKLNASAPVKPVNKSSKKTNNKDDNLFKLMLSSPLFKWVIILVVILGLAVVALIPASRYFILNSSGVRVSSSLKVLDEKTLLPLKNVELQSGTKSVKTDVNGEATINGLKLGPQEITIKKPGFAELKKTHVFGWGSNPLGEFKLTPTGTQFTFKIKDFLSDKPITKAEVKYQESDAAFNDKGLATLTIPKIDKDQFEITLTADNYREEKVTIENNKKDETVISMVPSRQHVYVSKRSGKFDLYKSYVDGKSEEILESGTGLEKEDTLSLSMHPSKNLVAYSSSRESVRNQDGFLLNTLQIIDIDSKQTFKVAQSERIQIVDWIGNRLIYVKITQGASQANLSRHKIMSYDVESHNEKELASTNYFNDVVSANGYIYYSPSQYQVNGSVGLFRISADGSDKKTIYDKEVWNIFRTSFDKFNISVDRDWYELNLADNKMSKIGGAPSVLKSRVYISSADGKQNLWVDSRDGKTVLIKYDKEKNKDDVIQTQNGIKNPIYWLDNDHVVYRVSDGREVADYVMSLSGGQPLKINDVTDTVGVDRWYYF